MVIIRSCSSSVEYLLKRNFLTMRYAIAVSIVVPDFEIIQAETDLCLMESNTRLYSFPERLNHRKIT